MGYPMKTVMFLDVPGLPEISAAGAGASLKYNTTRIPACIDEET